MARLVNTALIITLSPGSVRTISEALRAASVASATAIPISAFFRAGASFTPSPVIPQMCFLPCNIFTISYLCSAGNIGNEFRKELQYEHYWSTQEYNLVTRKNTSKAICFFYEFVNRQGCNGLILMISKKERWGIHVCTHPKASPCFLSYCQLVTWKRSHTYKAQQEWEEKAAT